MSLAREISRSICLYSTHTHTRPALPGSFTYNSDIEIPFPRDILAKTVAAWHSCYRAPRKSCHENNTATSGYTTYTSFMQCYKHDGMAHVGNFKIHQGCKNVPSPERRAHLHLCILWQGKIGKWALKTVNQENNSPIFKKKDFTLHMAGDYYIAIIGASLCSIFSEIIYREWGKDWIS